MAKLKEITLPINVVFSGEITVKATSTEQAWLLIQQHVFTHLGEINTDNNDITDWNICTHGDIKLK